MAARLVHTELGLGLVDDDAPELSPLVIDLGSPRRLTRRDDLIKACGWEKGLRTVVDGTAGLGRDALAMAAYGFHVVACERHPLVQGLWRDALTRKQPERLRFVEVDGGTWLAGLDDADRPEVVYLDPMYPHGPRKALQQRELRILRAAVVDIANAADADDAVERHRADVASLFSVALATARRRVVVKRPRWAAPLGPTPDHTWDGASTKYDLYLV
jgi:16S rRNA (guanine1516-N2)-methyltransferase